MPRRSRYAIAGIAHHVVQRGHNREGVFFSDDDRSYYLECLENAAVQYDCQVHAYVLMPNHVHLLVTPRQVMGVSRMMQSIGRRYVRHINHRYRRSGTLWEGRYRACLVSNGEHLLDCQQYIETNPVRALLAPRAADYPWSSYAHNALGMASDCLTEHPSYQALGASVGLRSACYEQRSRQSLGEEALNEIRGALDGSRAYGPKQFERDLEQQLQRRIAAGKRGRPPKRVMLPVAEVAEAA